MSPQLAAFFAAHKVQILGGGAAAVAALGLYQRKKKAAAAPATTAGATIPGTIPAATVVGGTSAATYDSTAADLYDLQSQISDLQSARQTTGTSGAAAAATPAPIASTLYAPNYTGQYFTMGSGAGEIESDGSLFVMSQPQWAAAQQAHPGTVTGLGSSNLPGVNAYSTAYNIQHNQPTQPTQTSGA